MYSVNGLGVLLCTIIVEQCVHATAYTKCVQFTKSNVYSLQSLGVLYNKRVEPRLHAIHKKYVEVNKSCTRPM